MVVLVIVYVLVGRAATLGLGFRRSMLGWTQIAGFIISEYSPEGIQNLLHAWLMEYICAIFPMSRGA